MTRPDAIVVRRFRVFGLWILRRCQKIGFLWTKFAVVGNFAAIFGPLLRNHYVAQCLYLGFLETALFTMAASRCESLQKHRFPQFLSTRRQKSGIEAEIPFAQGRK